MIPTVLLLLIITMQDTHSVQEPPKLQCQAADFIHLPRLGRRGPLSPQAPPRQNRGGIYPGMPGVGLWCSHLFDTLMSVRFCCFLFFSFLFLQTFLDRNPSRRTTSPDTYTQETHKHDIHKMADISFPLNTGKKIPAVGYGMTATPPWHCPPSRQTDVFTPPRRHAPC